MRFSTEFSVAAEPGADDWFDPVLNQDTPLYVDPFLVFDDSDPFWADAKAEVIEFFEAAAGLIEEANGNKNALSYRKAIDLLHFPEPNEFALGLAMGSPRGSGTGSEFAYKMADTLDLVRKHGSAEDLASIGGFSLFCEGLGLDRISDILCNILKPRFIEYTQLVAKAHGVPMESVKVRHATWNPTRRRWVDEEVDLPKSPFGGGGVLLTPERFLKEIPRVTPDGMWGWAQANFAQELRDDLNYDLSKSLTKQERAQAAYEVAHKRPEIALDYIRHVAESPHLPYDVEEDPKGLVRWLEAGQAAALALGLMTPDKAPKTAAEFNDWVLQLAKDFKHAVEEGGLWLALWSDGQTKHQQEKVAQAVAGAMWTAECRAANVDISQEVNRGRGPVDFKFSKGWKLRGLLEVKFIENSKFFAGASKQLPQYLSTEQVTYGVYLAIGFTDADFKPDRQNRVLDTVKAMNAVGKTKIDVVFVDARKSTKTSASKLKESDG